MEDLTAQRLGFLSDNDIADRIRPVVLESWRRSRGYGVDPHTLPVQHVSRKRLDEAHASNGRLLRAAEPFLAIAHERLGTRPHILALSDRDGRILKLYAEPKACPDDLKANLFEGASWHEQDVGCNGIGTALASGQPVILIGPEHFHQAYVGWTCIGAPLHSADGTLVGALDLCTPNERVDTGTWGWILSIADAVEKSVAAVEAGADPPDAAVDDFGNPFQAVRGVLKLLGGPGPLGRTHAEFIAEAERRVLDAEAEFRATMRREAETVQSLREMNATLERRIAERTSELEARDREIRQLAFVASHDIQEPLRKIQTFTTLLADEYGDRLGDGAAAYLKRIGAAAREMSAILSDLLAFGRIAMVEPSFKKVRLRQIVDTALATRKELIAATHARVSVEGDGSVHGDPRLLSRLVGEIVKNALVFRREGAAPRVEVVIREATLESDQGGEQGFSLTVADNGLGFDARYADLIFEPFERLHRVEGGTGMGLTICRRIAERHRGRITAESEPGVGTRITVTLPVRP